MRNETESQKFKTVPTFEITILIYLEFIFVNNCQDIVHGF